MALSKSDTARLKQRHRPDWEGETGREKKQKKSLPPGSVLRKLKERQDILPKGKGAYLASGEPLARRLMGQYRWEYFCYFEEEEGEKIEPGKKETDPGNRCELSKGLAQTFQNVPHVCLLSTLLLQSLISGICAGPPESAASSSSTFILVIGANGDNSQAHICILVHADFIQPLSEDRLVVVDVADENPHIRCVCRNDSVGRD